jgi:hypothetical protein
MGAEEVALLVALQQFANAVSVYLGKITPLPTNVFAAAAVTVGKQLAANVAKGAALGLVAAQNEFTTTNSQEKAFVTGISALPPVT